MEKKKYLREQLLEKGQEFKSEWMEIKFSDIKDALPGIELLRADQSIETTTAEFKGTFTTEVRSIIREEKGKANGGTLL